LLKSQALSRIDMVLESTFEPATAYPLRARLGRAVLAATTYFQSAKHDVPDSARIVLDRLEASVTHVMQPSEPFDSSWRQQWAEILDDLRTLRSQVTNTPGVL
jgi:hypothetical protein